MGFQKRWDVSNICQQISSCRAEVVNPYNDGYNAWSCKQDLYRIKYFLDDALDMYAEYFLKIHNLKLFIYLISFFLIK